MAAVGPPSANDATIGATPKMIVTRPSSVDPRDEVAIPTAIQTMTPKTVGSRPATLNGTAMAGASGTTAVSPMSIAKPTNT